MLNRIDEIVCFNPFAGEQLRKVARLSMRAGRHLVDGPPLALTTSLMDLFRAASDPVSILDRPTVEFFLLSLLRMS